VTSPLSAPEGEFPPEGGSGPESGSGPGGGSAPGGRRGRGELLAFVLMLGFLCTVVAQMAVPITATLLREERLLTSAQVGTLMSIMFFTSGPMHLVGGGLVRRYGGRLLLLGLATMLGGMVLLAVFSRYELMLVGRAVQGIGAGVMLPVAGHLMSRHVAPGRLGRAWSIYGAGAGIGNLLVFFGLSRVASLGIAPVFWAAGGVVAVVALVSLSLREIRSAPPAGAVRCGLGRTLKDLGFDVGRLARIPSLGLIAFFSVAIISCAVGVTTWAPSFLVDTQGLSVAAAGSIVGAYAAAQFAATFSVGLIVDRVGKTRILLAASAGLTLALVGLAFSRTPAAGLTTILLIGFLQMATFAPAFALIPGLVPPESVALGSGAVNGVGVFGALLAPWIMGIILDAGGGYRPAFLLLAGVAFVAVVLAAALVRRAGAVAEAPGPGPRGGV